MSLTLRWCAAVAALLAASLAGCARHVDVLGDAADNHRPTAATVTIFPDDPTAGEPLQAILTAAAWDADGDDLVHDLVWYRDGTEAGSGQVIGEGTTDDGEHWSVSVRAHDGTAYGPPTYAAVWIGGGPIADDDDDDDATHPDDGDGDGWTPDDGDCDDTDPGVHPGAHEDCDGQDNDCDGDADEGCDGVCGDGLSAGSCEECDGADDAACPGACSAHCACPSHAPGALEVHLIDVWQGDAILVISPDGFSMLVDSGKDSELDSLVDYLGQLGITHLDYTLASHMHEDHIGGLDDILATHPEVVAAFDHGGYYTTNAYSSYVWAAGSCRRSLYLGDLLDLGPATTVDVLHAYTGDDNENLNSLVLRITHGDVSVLLGGDCEAYGCEYSFDPGPIDIYKVHHHGSSDSSSDHLLDAMQPRLALIPVGQGNSYGHPHYQVVGALEDRGATIKRTDHDGDVVVTSDGEGIWVDGVEVE